MSDIADRAQDHIEREEPLMLAAGKRPPGPTPNGFCHNCGEPVANLFCDNDCRDDFEARTAANRRLRSRD